MIYTLTATDFQFQKKRNDLCIISHRGVINGYLQAAWRFSSKVFFCLLWGPFCGVFFPTSSNCCAIFTACISLSVAQLTFLRFLMPHFILSHLEQASLKFVASGTPPPSLPVPDQTGFSTQTQTLLKARQWTCAEAHSFTTSPSSPTPSTHPASVLTSFMLRL